MLPRVYSDIELQFEEDVEVALAQGSKTGFHSLFGINDWGSVCSSPHPEEFTFLNHGAFGGALSPVLKASHSLRAHCEAQPLRFFDRELFPLVVHSLHHLARVLGCSSTELFPLVNVTTGMNCVLNSVLGQAARNPTRKTVVLYLSLTYGSTKKIVQHTVCRHNEISGATSPPIRHQMVDIPLPIRDPEADIVAAIAGSMIESDTQYILIVDAVTSNTAVALPVVEIARACRAAHPSAVIVVDAAHSLFAQDIQLYTNSEAKSKTGASCLGPPSGERKQDLADSVDFYLTNCHKWFCGGKGAAVMWAHPRHHGVLEPAVVSHGYSPAAGAGGDAGTSPGGRLLSGFIWDGCRDYTSLVCAPMVSAAWVRVNRCLVPPWPPPATPGPVSLALDLDVGHIRAHNRVTLLEGRALLMHSWGLTEADMPYPPGVLTQSSPMTLVPVPAFLEEKMGRAMSVSAAGWTDAHSFALQEWLHHHKRIEVPVKGICDKGYFRISAHLYNDASDYGRLADAVLSLC